MKLPSGYLRFTVKMLLLSLGCSIMAVVLLKNGIIRLSGVFALGPVALFFLLSQILHYFFLKALQGRPQQFINAFMGGQALKMFIHLMVLTLVSFGFPQMAIHFIILYAVYYLLFTIAEVAGLGSVSVSRLQNEPGN
jgi:hypothetical protein